MLLEKIFVKSKTMQIRKQNIISLVLLGGLFVSSCSHKVDTDFGSGLGGVTIELATDVATATKAEIEEGSLDVNQFRVEILNDKGVIFKRWMTYADYLAEEDKTIPLNAGKTYTIVATYGEPYKVGFDVVYFKGEQEFVVYPQRTTNVDVTCTMANAKIGVEFGNVMTKEYENIIAKVYNRFGTLTFTEDNITENGYVPAESLTLDVELTSKENGKTYYFRKTDIEIQPRDFKILKLDTEEVPEMGVTINLTIDDQTEEISKEIQIPSLFLPLDAPEINMVGFNEDGVASFTESVVPNDMNVSIFAEATIQTYTMSIESATLSKLGFPSSIDMLNIPEEVKFVLDNHKLYYPVEKNLATVDFKEFAKLFVYNRNEAANTHTFTFKVTDTLGKETTQVVKFIPTEANKTINDIPAGDVWARKVYLTMNTTNGIADKLYPEISTDGVLWKRAAYETESVSGTAHKVKIKELESGTSYQFRAAYNDYGSAETKTVTTEVAAQVVNESFEDWTKQTHSDDRGSRDWYQPWGGGSAQWWAVNSMKSLASTTTVWGIFNAERNHRMVPTVSYSTNAHSGSKSAHIFSVMTGNSVTAESEVSGEVYVGELFVGTSANDGSAATSSGAFASRPSAIKFYYMFAPQGSEKFYVKYEIKDAENNVIASKEITDGPSASGWTEYTIPVEYTDMMKKAASISIVFKATSSGSPKTEAKKTIEFSGSDEQGHFGSSLRIDDINLIYE